MSKYDWITVGVILGVLYIGASYHKVAVQSEHAVVTPAPPAPTGSPPQGSAAPTEPEAPAAYVPPSPPPPQGEPTPAVPAPAAEPAPAPVPVPVPVPLAETKPEAASLPPTLLNESTPTWLPVEGPATKITPGAGVPRVRCLVFLKSHYPDCQRQQQDLTRMSQFGWVISDQSYEAHCQLAMPIQGAWYSAVAHFYNIKEFPTLVVVDSQGKELSRYQGFLPAVSLVEWLNQYLLPHPRSLNSTHNTVPPAQTGSNTLQDNSYSRPARGRLLHRG